MNQTVHLTECLGDFFTQGTKQFLSLFYIFTDIEETIQDNAKDVPNYEIMLFPFFSLLIFLEQVIRLYQRKDLSRFEDCVINVGSALIFTLTRIFLYVVVVQLFEYLYDNHRLVNLPLHSVSTWLISLLLVEFVYYWTHRALHEFNILWAAHQFHHMAEDINITTTIRDSVLDLIIYDIFPIPLALVIPPQILAIHIQFSLIYQIWLHNEVVGHLGLLEYLVNTPRQHRVHHGKNPYCIDKNYGALIMIWDRLFGTYQEELNSEKIVFGCVAPTPATFDPITLQFGYYRDVIAKFNQVQGWRNKLSALFKGPGWSPGKPRLGLLSDVPKPNPSGCKYTYQPYISTWKKVYVYVHGFIIAMGFYLMADHPLVRFSPSKGVLCMLYVIFALTSFGAIFDNKWYIEIIEVNRCLIYFAFDKYLISSVAWPLGVRQSTILHSSLWFIRLVHMASISLWLMHYFFRMRQSQVTFRSVPSSKIANQPKVSSEFGRSAPRGAHMRPLILITLATLTILSAIVFFIAYFFTISTCVQLFEGY